MTTYFTFPDGGLRYDCASCRQRCCRGKGIALAATELLPLLRQAPQATPFLRLRPGGQVAAVNAADGCWFLETDGLCAIERGGGRERKPATCRLFPFNRIYQLGAVRIVDMNSMLCPLEPVAAGEPGGVTHGELLAELAALGEARVLTVEAAAPPGLPADWLALEEQAAQPALGAGDDDPQGEAATAAWGRLYGLAAPEHQALAAQVRPLVALLTPSLRWNRLFRRSAAPYGEVAPRLPRRLRGLDLLGALAARAAGHRPSLRTLTELWEGQAPLLDVLERWDEPVRLTSPQFDADVPPALMPAVGALLGGAFRGARRLGDLVEGAAAAVDPSLAPLAVMVAAGQLDRLRPA